MQVLTSSPVPNRQPPSRGEPAPNMQQRACPRPLSAVWLPLGYAHFSPFLVNLADSSKPTRRNFRFSSEWQ